MCSSKLCLICLGLFILSLFSGSGDCTKTEPDQYDHSSGNVTPKEDSLRQITPTLSSSEAARIAKRDFYISKLIKRFGNEQGFLTIDGLDKLLHQLGFKDDQHEDHIDSHDNHDSHDHHNHSQYEIHHHRNESHDHDYHNEENYNHVHERSVQNTSSDKESLTLNSLLQDFGLKDKISKSQFISLCPGFLFMLLGLDHEHHDHLEVPPQTAVSAYPPLEVWGMSCLSVIIISLIGLLGVAVIPIMQKVFYNHLLQFLVALAVGALAGDAMLHLIPHAFHVVGHSSDDNESHDKADHMVPVMKGLCGLGGIYLFFLMERLLTIHTEQKRKRRMGKAKYANNRTVFNEESTFISHGRNALKSEPDCEEMVMGIHPGHKALKSYAEESHNTDCHKLNEEEDHVNCNKNSDLEEPQLVLSHSHGVHGHSHCHNVPKTISAIAWMVILGDGIHNFSDGLAVGAAFASSITGGISTSIAIFCHELPHEIGDFAVLLRAGMTVKQALVYNCISSILALFGMVIGIFLGNIEGASSWIFVGVAGMFLYIALVDMLPQVSGVDTKKGEHPLCHLLLQISGMLIGGGIMLIVAVYEHDMKNIL